MKKKVIFIHIPKTAGTSINTLLSYQYGHRGNFWHTTQESWEIAKARFIEHIRVHPDDCNLVRGHIPYGWDSIAPRNYKYITFLRDPLERSVSQYNFAINHGRGIWFDELSAFDGLEDYLCNVNLIGHDNYQLRYLSGIGPRKAVARIHLEQTCGRIKDEQIVVGCLSHMQESIILMSAILGWKKPIFNLRYNLGGQRSRVDIPKSVEAKFRDLNALDYELYDYARSGLYEVISKHKRAYELRMKLFKLYGPTCAKMAHYLGNIYRKFQKKEVDR